MKVALASIRPKIGNKDENLKKMVKYIKSEKADLFVFGESSITGYRCKDELRDLAEPMDGYSINTISQVANKHNCYVIFGMPTLDEKIKGIIHNSAILIHPNKKVDCYHKWFLPTSGPFEEKIYFDEGELLKIFDTKIGKIGLLICYDIYFPEICKAYTLMGADIIICISASPSTTRKYFETLIPARAIENTVFMIYSNIVGTQEDLVFWGGSQAYDPLGNLIKKSDYFKENIISFNIDLDDLKSVRMNRRFISDIRPEIYQDLYDISRFRYDNLK
jgi:predicted amidohydrolase